MAITFVEVEALLLEILGEPPTPPFSSYSFANDAGRLVYALNPAGWRFATGTTQPLSLIADSEVIPLPSNFGLMRSAKLRRELLGRVQFVDIDELEDLRVSGSLTSFNGSLWIAQGWTDLSATAAPQPQLEVWPTPTANTVDAMRIRYVRRWPELSARTDIVPVPDFCELLYKQILVAVAQGWMERDYGSIAARAAEAASTFLPLALRAEGMSMPSIGQMRGGAVAEDSNWTSWFRTDAVTM